ncbi:MAG: NADH:ubiquinone oxidoreductase [Gammaproteobacteria bacterium]|nr:MAG: NADH:ubiquinone oxidoreductase [Gammaproteobacteria bacterium]
MSKVKLTINGVSIEVEKGTTILEAAKSLDIGIPTLCYVDLKEFNVKNKVGSCRICVVEVDGRNNLAPSCCTPCEEGMVVITNSARVLHARRTILQLLLSDHPKECLTCKKSGECELQDLAAEYRVHEIRYEGEESSYPADRANKSIYRDPNKCIMCRRCETACNDMQKVGILSGTERGFGAVVDTAAHSKLADTYCTFCGQCVSVCPTGALTSITYNQEVIEALADPSKVVIAQTAPAVRVAIGESFAEEPGTISTGKMVAALKKLNFDYVFDTDFAADLTIMEEANEMLDRIKNGGKLPILTSCCPAWVKLLEHQFPEMVNIPSSAKSPQQMFGAVAKHYWAKKMGIDPHNVVVVSVMPCLAKKYESAREEMKSDGVPDVDYVMSTRELAVLLKESGINMSNLKEQEYDNPLGESTGAAVIFGAAGGVLEAALRTAYEWFTGKELAEVNFEAVRGIDGIKSAEIDLDGTTVKVAQASGLGNARELLNKIRKGEEAYHAIEIMACPGGCINGGGQPFIHGDTSIIKKRQEALYNIDSNEEIRKSHENPMIKKLYKEWLDKPGSHEAHKYLHTEYFERGI